VCRVSLLTVVIYLVTFASVTLFVFASIRVLRDFARVPLAEDDLLEGTGIRKNPVFRAMMIVARLLARVNLNLNLGAYETLLKRKLDAAGSPWDLKPAEYLAIKQLCAFLVGGVGILMHFVMAKSQFPLFNAVVMIVFGFMIPNAVLNSLTRKRHLSILQDLPFTCDLLTLSVEAGLDFGSSLEKVVLNGPPGPLRDELHSVLQETRIGKTRRDALVDFAGRVQLQEVTNFSGAIVQADRMGTGFANVLRIQSAQIRRGRFERAEKMAQKLPVKILFPIIVVNLLSIGIILVIPLLSTITTFIR
jgi:tight adherence protein C